MAHRAAQLLNMNLSVMELYLIGDKIVPMPAKYRQLNHSQVLGMNNKHAPVQVYTTDYKSTEGGASYKYNLK
jgi:hypothetical protein